MLHMEQAQYFSRFLNPIQMGIFIDPISLNIIEKIHIQYQSSASFKDEPSNDKS